MVRSFFQGLTLRGKLTFLITFTSCFVLCLTISASMFFQWGRLREELLEDALLLSFEIKEDCAQALKMHDLDSLDRILAIVPLKREFSSAVIFDENQQIVTSISAANGLELPDLAGRQYGHQFGASYFDLVEPLRLDDETLGYLAIRANMAPVYSTMWHYVIIGGAAFLVYSLIALLIARSLQRLITDRVSTLARAMDQVSQDKDYSRRVKKRANDEIGQLFDGFNRMLGEIEKRETELRENESRLDFLAHHDHLTQLGNRRLLQARLEHALARCRRTQSRLALLFIDLDRFKNINDSLGHDFGDKILSHVASCLKSHVRESDTLARLGGDEFVIILEQVKKNDDLRRFVQKLLRELAKPLEEKGLQLHVTATMGISFFPEDGTDSDSLMRAADAAMYQAKYDGRNRFQFFSPEMNSLSRASLKMENLLRKALERGEFRLEYQSQYDLKTGQLIGFEALLRWENEDLGVVSPADFIPLAEEIGAIVPIGDWILVSACQTIKNLQEKWQIPLSVAVNISPRQFRDDSLVGSVARALYRSGLAPGSLELEITEGTVMDNVKDAISKMEQFKKMGVHLAIDDFGTGYSSLGYLKQFPISRLKIDQSFVRDLEISTSDKAIVNSIIALGRTMNLEVVAEGIEDFSQLDFLRNEGCHFGQGYLMGHPLAKEDLAETVARKIPLAADLHFRSSHQHRLDAAGSAEDKQIIHR